MGLFDRSSQAHMCIRVRLGVVQARELVQELEFEAINWIKVHKLWALERPGGFTLGAQKNALSHAIEDRAFERPGHLGHRCLLPLG